MFESLVHSQLYEYLNSSNILNPAQFGFRPNHNTQDVLLRSVDDWKVALDRNIIVSTIMVDLSKAFDTINHPLLLKKLDHCDITGRGLKWLSEYLLNRKQSDVE